MFVINRNLMRLGCAAESLERVLFPYGCADPKCASLFRLTSSITASSDVNMHRKYQNNDFSPPDDRAASHASASSSEAGPRLFSASTANREARRHIGLVWVPEDIERAIESLAREHYGGTLE